MKKVYITEFAQDLEGIDYEPFERDLSEPWFEYIMMVDDLDVGDLILYNGDLYKVSHIAEKN